FELFVCELLHTNVVLDHHFPRDQQDQKLEEDRRLLSHHLVDCSCTTFAENFVYLADGVVIELASGAIPANATSTETTVRDVELAARTIGLQIQVLNAGTSLL